MAVSLTFLPVKLADILNYAQQVHDLISGEGFTIADVGLVSGDVTSLGTKLTAAQDAFGAVNAANASAKSATLALTGPGAAMDQLVQELRDLANKSRASTATDDALGEIGILRKGAPTPIAAPTVSPEISVQSVSPNIVNLRFREAGSANPRAKLASAGGVQVAVVNAATPPADGEADEAPNVFVTRSPAAMNSAGWPASVRLYARWVTKKGLVGPWSDYANAQVQ